MCIANFPIREDFFPLICVFGVLFFFLLYNCHLGKKGLDLCFKCDCLFVPCSCSFFLNIAWMLPIVVIAHILVFCSVFLTGVYTHLSVLLQLGTTFLSYS